MNRVKKQPLYAAATLLLGLIVNGCSDSTEQPFLGGDAQGSGQQSLSSQSSRVLAVVNGSEISEDELLFTVEKILGSQAGLFFSDDLQKKVLQSLIQAKVIAAQAKAEMGKEQQVHIQRQVIAYEEELLMKWYLQKHVNPSVVSRDAIKAYYDSHRDRFGAETIKRFEYIASVGNISADTKNKLKVSFAVLQESQSWHDVSVSLKGQAMPVKYKIAELNPERLDGLARQLAIGLKPGEYDIIEAENQIIAMRVLTERKTATKPLTEVSSEIRSILTHQYLKKAVKKLAEGLLENADITRVAE